MSTVSYPEHPKSNIYVYLSITVLFSPSKSLDACEAIFSHGKLCNTVLRLSPWIRLPFTLKYYTNLLPNPNLFSIILLMIYLERIIT